MNYLKALIVFFALLNLCSCCFWKTYECSRHQAINHCGRKTKCKIETGLFRDKVHCRCSTGGKWPNCVECARNSHCRSDQACLRNTCRNPCIGKCGVGAKCNVKHHKARCYCIGYGDPKVRCVECMSDSHCRSDQACIGNTCRNPCIRKSCGDGAECEVKHHKAKCYCSKGYADRYGKCVECTSNSHCRSNQACIDNTCRNPCTGKSCGEGAKCDVTHHEARCSCVIGYGDPNVRCVECMTDNHCPSNQACVGNTCRNPCVGKCGVDAKCDVMHHKARCSCLHGYGDPNVRCVECMSDSHCRSDQACDANTCRNLCIGKSCGEGAKCDVIHHKATCSCLHGYGDPNVRCVECMSDSHCRSDQACDANTCRNLCIGKSCGEGAKCDVIHHKVTCSCLHGYGDPNVRCVECMSDSHCRSDQACIGNACTDPCVGACGRGAVCEVMEHQAECRCPDNAFGNPHDVCFQRKPEVPQKQIAGDQ